MRSEVTVLGLSCPSTFSATTRDKQVNSDTNGFSASFLKGDFCKSAAFRSYGMKTK